MEKTIALRNTDITFSIWDLGGQQEYLHMLPLVCNDAVALLFMFDLSRKSTLTSVKNWSVRHMIAMTESVAVGDAESWQLGAGAASFSVSPPIGAPVCSFHLACHNNVCYV